MLTRLPDPLIPLTLRFAIVEGPAAAFVGRTGAFPLFLDDRVGAVTVEVRVDDIVRCGAGGEDESAVEVFEREGRTGFSGELGGAGLMARGREADARLEVRASMLGREAIEVGMREAA